jgi:hypothetical protein
MGYKIFYLFLVLIQLGIVLFSSYNVFLKTDYYTTIFFSFGMASFIKIIIDSLGKQIKKNK